MVGNKKERNKLTTYNQIDEKITPQKPKMSFEEACNVYRGVTLEEFFQELNQIIDNDNRLI